MGKWLHVKPEPVDVQGICVVCNKNVQKSKVGGKYRAICSPCDKKRHKTETARKTARRASAKQKRPYRQYVESTCSRCGFVAEHICQMDVHHKDHNHENDDPTNLVTLCANCHRLEHR